MRRAKNHPLYKPYARQPDTRKGDRHIDNTIDRHRKPQRGDRHKNDKRRKKHWFVALDGEGITTQNIVGHTEEKKPVYEHRYVLLMASTGEYISNPDGLSTVACFDFLLGLAQHYPDAIFVCFGASYDVNMMLADVPKKVLMELWAGRDNNADNKPANFSGNNNRRYALSYRPRKSFVLRRFNKEHPWVLKVTKHKNGTQSENWVANYDASLTLWDVFGFFQGRFVDALGHPKNGVFY